MDSFSPSDFFQLFKNAKIILSLTVMQKQLAVWIWPLDYCLLTSALGDQEINKRGWIRNF